MKRTGILLAVSAGLIVAGLILSQNELIWRKAVSICLECVGIG